MSDTIPQITITPAPENRATSGIVSKFYGGHNPSSPAAAAGDGDFSFSDIVDMINPLQHLPIIGTIYRAITGDQPSTESKLAGDTAYGAILGGPLGALFSLASSAFGELFGIDEALSPTADNAKTAETAAKVEG